MFVMDVSLFICVRLRKTNLPPLWGGCFFKPIPGVKTSG
jgi:hypothetical protein